MDKFWRLVDKTPGQGPNGECWMWTGCTVKGYGIFCHNGRSYRAHRFSFAMSIGPITPSTMLVCHSCDNPGCVRPDHLWLGTDRDNAIDRESKNRGNTAHGDGHGMRKHPERAPMGSRNSNAKMTESDVVAARISHADGVSILSLSEAYGVTRGNMRKAVRGITWRHVK